MFTCTTVAAALDIAAKGTEEIFGSKLLLEAGYALSIPQEEQALKITFSSSLVMDDPLLKQSIEHYLRNAKIKIKSCTVCSKVAYITLEDPWSKCSSYKFEKDKRYFLDNLGNSRLNTV